MADTKPKFDLHPYKPSDKPGHYDDEVQALLDAGKGIAITIQIPGDKDPEKADKLVKKHQAWFYESARKFDRSAKMTDVSDQEDGSIHLDFILRDSAIKRPRKAKAETPEEVSSDDTPSEVAA